MAANDADSREKLAADVLRFARELTDEALVMGAHEASWYPNIGGLRECIAAYLDRQAAITRRETRQSWQDAPNILDRENLRTIDRLTAERDELRKESDRWHVEQVHAYGNWEDVHEYAKKLEAERDELRDKLAEKQHVCDVQRESFRKMEADLAAMGRLALGLWRRMDALRMAGIAPSKGDLDALAARLAEHGIEAS